jgi:hypothetical protein
MGVHDPTRRFTIDRSHLRIQPAALRVGEPGDDPCGLEFVSGVGMGPG